MVRERKCFSANTLAQDQKIGDAVGAIAKARGVLPAQVGLAWLVQKKDVTAPILLSRAGSLLRSSFVG